MAIPYTPFSPTRPEGSDTPADAPVTATQDHGGAIPESGGVEHAPGKRTDERAEGGAKARGKADGQPVIVKKYANRRLYNTESSSYITLDHLAKLTREGRDFVVIDARTEEDITHTVLTQIIMDEESRGAALLPASFLRQLISMYGDSMQSLVPQYLEASMAAFRHNQSQFSDAMKGALERSGPLGEIARRNFEMFEAATAAFTSRHTATARAEAKAEDSRKSTDEELRVVKQQLAELQAKLDRLTQ